jgi:uncharacterized RDD family membrane protein YckC
MLPEPPPVSMPIGAVYRRAVATEAARRFEAYRPWDMASLGQRFSGRVIDSVALFGAPIAGNILYDEVGVVVGLALAVAGQSWLVARSGQTLGKLLVGTRAVPIDGSPPGFLHAFLGRELIMLLLHAWGLGSVIDACMIFRESRRCWHDEWLKTVVVRADVRPRRRKRKKRDTPSAEARRSK